MSSELEVNVHSCAHPSCKCAVEEKSEECCSPFCQDVEPSETDHHCGCGHMACDVSTELGNVAGE